MLRILFWSWHTRQALVRGVNRIWSSATWPSTSPAWFSAFFSIQLKVMRAPFKDKTLHLSHLITPHQLFMISHRALRLSITHPISFHYLYSCYIVPIYEKPSSFVCILFHQKSFHNWTTSLCQWLSVLHPPPVMGPLGQLGSDPVVYVVRPFPVKTVIG